MKLTDAISRHLLFQLSMVGALLLTSCGSGLDAGDGKGGDCQPCNANRVCDSGLLCYSFSGGKELCAKPSTKSCFSSNGNGEPMSILSTLKIPANSRVSGLDLATN
jgi:hypothetical protein